jgi:hypothetical protein
VKGCPRIVPCSIIPAAVIVRDDACVAGLRAPKMQAQPEFVESGAMEELHGFSPFFIFLASSSFAPDRTRIVSIMRRPL